MANNTFSRWALRILSGWIKFMAFIFVLTVCLPLYLIYTYAFRWPIWKPLMFARGIILMKLLRPTTYRELTSDRRELVRNIMSKLALHRIPARRAAKKIMKEREEELIRLEKGKQVEGAVGKVPLKPGLMRLPAEIRMRIWAHVYDVSGVHIFREGRRLRHYVCTSKRWPTHWRIGEDGENELVPSPEVLIAMQQPSSSRNSGLFGNNNNNSDSQVRLEMAPSGLFWCACMYENGYRTLNRVFHNHTKARDRQRLREGQKKPIKATFKRIEGDDKHKELRLTMVHKISKQIYNESLPLLYALPLIFPTQNLFKSFTTTLPPSYFSLVKNIHLHVQFDIYKTHNHFLYPDHPDLPTSSSPPLTANNLAAAVTAANNNATANAGPAPAPVVPPAPGVSNNASPSQPRNFLRRHLLDPLTRTVTPRGHTSLPRPTLSLRSHQHTCQRQEYDWIAACLLLGHYPRLQHFSATVTELSRDHMWEMETAREDKVKRMVADVTVGVRRLFLAEKMRERSLGRAAESSETTSSAAVAATDEEAKDPGLRSTDVVMVGEPQGHRGSGRRVVGLTQFRAPNATAPTAAAAIAATTAAATTATASDASTTGVGNVTSAASNAAEAGSEASGSADEEQRRQLQIQKALAAGAGADMPYMGVVDGWVGFAGPPAVVWKRGGDVGDEFTSTEQVLEMREKRRRGGNRSQT